MIRIFGHNVQSIYKDGKDNEGIIHSYADMTRAKECLHFVPKIGIDSGLREILWPMLVKK
jgi:nucleoside-diphosphate-sugar epimerase